MLRPDPDQRHRLVEIRDNLIARITEAEQEGWLGEIEGLQVSLASAEEKLIQLDTEQVRQRQVINLGHGWRPTEWCNRSWLGSAPLVCPRVHRLLVNAP